MPERVLIIKMYVSFSQLALFLLLAALMPGLEGRQLFSSVQPGIEARLHASFSSFDGLEWEIQSPSQPLMSLYVESFTVDSKLIKPPVVPGLVAYDGPCSQKDQILLENSRIFSATRGATCLSIPATKNKKRASNLFLSVMVLAAALMPGLEGRRLFSSVQPGIEARLHASFSSFDGLEWEIRSPSQPLMSLYVDLFIVDNKLIKPPVVPGLVAYDGPCSQKDQILPENSRIFSATRGATCLSIPATKNKKRASNLYLSVMVLAAALMPGLEGRRLFSSVQPGIEARLHASFSSFDGLEWEIQSPSQPLMSLYVESFTVDSKLIKPPVVPGLVAYDGPCSQKNHKLPENTRIIYATRGATCLSIPATKNKKRASNLFLSVMVLAAALMPGLEGRRLFSSVQPGIEARLNASFSSFDGLEWEIRSPSQSLLSLYVERFIVDNKLTKPPVVPGLVAYDGPCSQKDQKLPENTRIFLATRGVMCLSLPATINKKRARNLFLSVMALGERRMDESFTEQNQIEPNIVGGRPISSIRRWPWMVSLQYLADHICGGVIIGRRWVVTAAHCLRNSFKPYPNLSVKAGTVDLYSNTATQIAVEKVIIHPGNFLQHYDDIALLKLKEPLRMSDTIQAIKLPQYDQKSYKRCFLTGWGKTSTYSYLSRYLKDIEMFIKKDSECNKRETILCADGEGSGCYGDSGGPLMCRDNEASSWKLVGILSHGQGCSKNAFTKVYSYLDWIHDTINLETSSDNDCSPENPGSCSPQRNIENAFPFSYKSSNDDLETGLSNTDSIMCSGHTTIDVTQPGTISSPGFQSYTPYPTNLDCQLNLKIPKNKVLSVQFFDFYLDGSKNCRFDRLEISESKNGRDYSVSKTLCGARRPDFLVIKGPNIKFRFVTSKLNFEAFTGFKLAYHIATEQGENKRIEQSCPKQLIIDGQSSGSITSPGFERGEYPPNQKCEYILRFPIEGRLKINFDVFSLEDECDYDAVTIFDPRNQYEIARFCGNNIPKDMILRGPAIGIRFESDEYAQFRGFRLFYSFHMIECGMRKSWNEQDSTRPTIKPESNVFSALKWPWMVSIQHPEGHYCGGSIIDEQWVLSSAKCFRNNSRKYSDFRVKAGAVDLDSTDATVVPVETITMYPGYRLKNPFDIALVKLKEPLKMSDSIQRICLPKQDRKSYKRCFSLGWPVKFPNQPRRPILTELELFIRKKEDYAKIIDYGWNFINDESCIKGDEIGCRVNTTGPLVCYNEASSKWRVVGIQTFRPGACDTTQQMLTKVFSYVDWIYDTMLGDSLNSIRETQEATIIVGLSNTDSIMCSGHSTIDVNQPGTVSSSGFQKNIPYPNNQDCVLYLRIPWKKVLSIQFLDFNLEESENCQFDRLEILESKNSRDYSFNKTLCGSKRPENLLIEGPIIKFHFVSDKYRQFSGFKFAYQLANQTGEIKQIDQSCPKQLIIDVQSSGSITSPGFERGEYPPDKKCEYILRFPADKRLKINFDVFSLEDECDYDSVTIFNPKTRNELGRFCGNNIPKDMSLSGPEVGVRFESDRFNQRRGFRLFYSLHTIECGVRDWSEDAQIEATVIQGGKVESIRKWPWMVSIRKGGFKYKHYCGGVIIDENWILSAKHCFKGVSSNTPDTDVLTGSLSSIDYYRQAVPVERIEYPGSSIEYQGPVMRFKDDIALLKLKQPLKMSEKRKPICIEKTDRKSYKQCFLAGWGKYLPNSNNADYLQEVKIPILSDGDCSYRFGTRYYHPPSMVCAGGNGWACKGDSGGPLMCYDESSLKWSVVGIVSFGFDCATFPYDAYSKVSYFAKWIQETMSKDKRNSTKEHRKAPSIVATSVKEDHEGPNIVGLSNTDSIMCLGHSTIDVTQPGTVSSPGFQKNIPYPNNQDCVLYLRIPWKKVLSIQFLDFNLEESENCKFDRLEILESKNSRDYSFNKTLCGSKRPENLLIEGPIIKFHFVSDKYRQFSGFKFAYQLATQKGEINQIDQSCPKQLIIDVRSSGNITSPGFERGEYPPNKKCEYILRFPADKRLKINFDVFSLEDECDYDSVTIFNPKTRNELGRFCGNNIPKDMSLSGPEVGVRFESDRFNQRRGFRLFYSLHTIECGVRDWTEDAQIEATVIQGGKVESIRKWPWMVSIRKGGFKYEHYCGGVIIDENWILSAKHCFRGASSNTPNIDVLTGSLGRIDYYRQAVPVERIEYPGSLMDLRDDIALLKLKQPLKMSEKRKPICIEKTDRKSFKQCFLAGWGRYLPNSNNADYLQEVKIPILSDEDCSYMFGTTDYHPPSMVCAGGNGWACKADSGGPLMCYDESSLTWSVVGIVSFGGDCATFPYDAYSKVSYFAKWIQETMSKDKRNSTKEGRKAPSIVANSVKEDHEGPNIVGLSNTDSIMCSGHSTIDVTQPGTVSSSGFQKNIPYPNNQDCVLYLRIPWKKVLSIQFLDFNLEESEKCQFDRLEILESKNSRDYSFNKTLCGSKRPENLLIEGPIIKFHFVSDKYRQFSGFKFAYQLATQKGEINQIDQSCPKQLIIDVRSSGNITSPGFERGEYPPNKKCEYILRFPAEKRLKINFDVFSLEDECDYDSVTIFNPKTRNELGRFCGNNIPKDMSLSGPEVGVRFESDRFNQRRGFRLFYSLHTIECGVREWTEDAQIEATVIQGGKVESIRKWPWMVSIRKGGFKYEHYCGGVIIDENWILSAKHCFRGASSNTPNIDVLTGSLGRIDYYRQAVPVERIEYPGSLMDLRDDIALLKLKQPLKMSEKRKPICIEKTDRKSFKQCFLAGWGKYLPNSNNAEYLQEVKIPILSDGDCSYRFGTRYYHPPSMVCAGGNGWACKADSGGPLMCYDESSLTWSVVGIVSFGGDCATFPYDAYSKVSYFAKWIQETMSKDKRNSTKEDRKAPSIVANSVKEDHEGPNIVGLSNTDSIMCSGHSTIDVTQPGTVSSPGFQKNIPYPNNQDCVLYLRIPWKKVLSIQFLDFNLEESENCQFDRLEILESKNSRDYSFNKTLCGSKRPENLLIEGPIIKFHFVSDKYRQFSGFKFAYQLATQKGEINQIDQSCPKQLIIDVRSSGNITSPGFERGEYPPNKNCEYILRFPTDVRLKINFDVFSLEDECDYDSVTIFNPKTRNELGRFCGNNIPKDMSLSGPEVGVRFESDRFNQRRGFRLFYSLHTIECGVRDWTEDAQIEATVIQGGKVESIRKWPWMVSIRERFVIHQHGCGGVIIDENWILSAKHCLEGVSTNTPNIFVLTGSLSSIDYYNQTVPVERIEYPGSSIEYQGPMTRFKDDIALLKLKQPLKMSEKRKPICIEKTDRKSFKQCFLAGWGQYPPNYNYAEDLREVKIPILSDEDCSYMFGTRYYHPPSMVCAGGNGWACYGDSGGPLMCYDESSLTWSVVGIASFGTGCESLRYNGYTKVSYFAKWIQETMSKDKRNSTKEDRKAPSIVATSVKEDHEATNIVGLSNTDSIMCSGHSTIDVTQPGTVSSSGFQKNIPYPNNQDCVLYLRIPWKKVLSIQFLDFNLEESEKCQFDRLEILESKNSRDYSFNKTLCGSKRPENLLIEGPIIKFHFVSDKYRQFSGFKFAYQLATQKGEINQIDQSCPKQLIIDVRSSGNITSPGFERGEYPPNKKCEYILRFPTDLRLKINFDVFSLEDECDYDAVTIFDPRNQYEIARFCGNNIPKDMILRGPAIGIRFESDEHVQFRGFRLFYSFHMIDEIKQIDQSCPKQLIIDVQSSGSITSPGFERGEYPPDKKCEYILRFPADKRLKINFDVFSLEDECDYDSVTIFNPKTRNELGRFCGNNIPKDMSLTGPEVGVRFESDNFNQRRGFRLFYSLHTIECGVRDWTEDAQIEATIIKGRRVESIRKWPWMVSLHRKEDGYVCGGMIINEHWVLTAAHCVTRSLRNRLTLYVQAGTLERESDSQLIPVERVDCLHNNIIYRDDVALVKLKEPLKMSENIAPICITKTDQKSFKRCVVTGWGTFSRYSGFNRFLHEAEVQIESDQFCASSFQIYNYHPPSMVCAGGNESACYGDSGGPLMCYDESSLRWTAVGIVSFGKKCGEILYGAYQKVSYFANWIEQMISKDENKGVLDGRFDFVKSHQQSTPQSHCWKFGDFFLYQGDDSEMEIEKPRRFCHELWSYENDYTDISKNGCNFDDSNLCNYYILENSNWKIQKNPQNSSDRYLVIYNKMKRPYQEVELWPPSFFFKSARCLSFKYKIEPVIGSLLSIIGEEIDISQDTIRKKSVWTSDSTAGWNKAQIVLSDSNFENFYFSMSIQAMASVAIDDISVNRWC